MQQDLNIIIPIFATPATERPKRRKWVKKWHIFGLHFAVANCRLKKRLDPQRLNGKGCDDMRDIKNQVYKKQHHRCPLCGQEFDYKQMEAHHVLPWGRFPELRMKKRNIAMLCHPCHKEVHCNPYLNLRLQEQKAQELGIDLKQRYNYGTEETHTQEPAS